MDFRDDGWKSWLYEIRQLASAPKVIVSSQRGESLWMEAPSLGCYDILACPYVGDEVLRVLSLAWSQWKRDRESRLFRPKPPGSVAQVSVAHLERAI
jgi:hypothetical protein